MCYFPQDVAIKPGSSLQHLFKSHGERFSVRSAVPCVLSPCLQQGTRCSFDAWGFGKLLSLPKTPSNWQRERKPRPPLHPPSLEGLKQNQSHYIFVFHSLWCKGTVYPPRSPRSVAGSTNSILQGESTTPVTYCPAAEGIPLLQERF